MHPRPHISQYCWKSWARSLPSTHLYHWHPLIPMILDIYSGNHSASGEWIEWKSSYSFGAVASTLASTSCGRTNKPTEPATCQLTLDATWHRRAGAHDSHLLPRGVEVRVRVHSRDSSRRCLIPMSSLIDDTTTTLLGLGVSFSSTIQFNDGAAVRAIDGLCLCLSFSFEY